MLVLIDFGKIIYNTLRKCGFVTNTLTYSTSLCVIIRDIVWPIFNCFQCFYHNTQNAFEFETLNKYTLLQSIFATDNSPIDFRFVPIAYS
jgi:hypothetical protein